MTVRNLDSRRHRHAWNVATWALAILACLAFWTLLIVGLREAFS